MSQGRSPGPDVAEFPDVYPSTPGPSPHFGHTEEGVMRLLTVIATALTLAGAVWHLVCRRSRQTVLWLGQGAYEQHG